VRDELKYSECSKECRIAIRIDECTKQTQWLPSPSGNHLKSASTLILIA